MVVVVVVSFPGVVAGTGFGTPRLIGSSYVEFVSVLLLGVGDGLIIWGTCGVVTPAAC